VSEENKIRDAADAVKGIVEAVPVYQDVVQPAAKEVGTALQTVARTIHVALAPLAILIWGYEQIREHLEETLAEKLKSIPSENINTPNPNVAGPTLEALRFAAHEPNLRELYVNLLATAMNTSASSEAHPAFVEILRQMTPDEAQLLKYIYDWDMMGTAWPMISGVIYAVTDAKAIHAYQVKHFSLLFEGVNLKFPELAPTYIDNLCRLGLLEIFKFDKDMAIFQTAGSHEELESHSQLKAYLQKNVKFSITEAQFDREIVRLTGLGSQFCRACIGSPAIAKSGAVGTIVAVTSRGYELDMDHPSPSKLRTSLGSNTQAQRPPQAKAKASKGGKKGGEK
jgi:hypothetical protein